MNSHFRSALVALFHVTSQEVMAFEKYGLHSERALRVFIRETFRGGGWLLNSAILLRWLGSATLLIVMGWLNAFRSSPDNWGFTTEYEALQFCIGMDLVITASWTAAWFATEWLRVAMIHTGMRNSSRMVGEHMFQCLKQFKVFLIIWVAVALHYLFKIGFFQ